MLVNKVLELKKEVSVRKKHAQNIFEDTWGKFENFKAEQAEGIFDQEKADLLSHLVDFSGKTGCVGQATQHIFPN